MHEKIIAQAIRDKRLLQFTYRGCDRLVEPHIYGLDAKGHEALSAYQVGGRSTSGAFGWKLFHIDEIPSMALSNRCFSHPRPDYNAADRSFAAVVIQL